VRLYQAAMQAWDKGDVTSALSKLEHLIKLDHDLPDSDAGRTGTYHSFYNQVHSEHNSLKSAYEDAKRSLAGENYEAALATCQQYLSKYPNHALFQALKFDIGERQRQALSAVIADTDRRVEAEADLHRRVGILDEALKLYPGEAHFERALKGVRDKRDLVNSIVAKVRYFEERGQFNEPAKTPRPCGSSRPTGAWKQANTNERFEPWRVLWPSFPGSPTCWNSAMSLSRHGLAPPRRCSFWRAPASSAKGERWKPAWIPSARPPNSIPAAP